jgi:hypothetical protein
MSVIYVCVCWVLLNTDWEDQPKQDDQSREDDGQEVEGGNDETADIDVVHAEEHFPRSVLKFLLEWTSSDP